MRFPMKSLSLVLFALTISMPVAQAKSKFKCQMPAQPAPIQLPDGYVEETSCYDYHSSFTSFTCKGNWITLMSGLLNEICEKKRAEHPSETLTCSTHVSTGYESSSITVFKVRTPSADEAKDFACTAAKDCMVQATSFGDFDEVAKWKAEADRLECR